MSPRRRCLGTARTGRQCRVRPAPGALFCRRHRHQGLQAWGGPADGCNVLVETLADVPFTAARDAGTLQLHRLAPGARSTGWYVLDVHPRTARPCARWLEPRPAAVPETEEGRS